MGPNNHALGEGPDFPREGHLGVVLPLKCIRQRKRQTSQRHGAADLSAGESASRRKHGFIMDSPAAGVTSLGAMRPFRQHFLAT